MLFAAEPEREMDVRRRIDAALAAGRVAGPDGGVTRWRLRSSAAGAVDPDEADHASRLVTDGCTPHQLHERQLGRLEKQPSLALVAAVSRRVLCSVRDARELGRTS